VKGSLRVIGIFSAMQMSRTVSLRNLSFPMSALA